MNTNETKQPAETIKSLPKEPPIGLLMSMALRYDHGLGCPGYYDQPIFCRNGVTHARRLESTISTMRQLYEEVSGNGFYSPDKEASYVDMHEKAKAIPQSPTSEGGL